MPLPVLVAWRRTDRDGLCLARLARDEDGFAADGHEVVAGRAPYASYFGVALDEHWQTLWVTVGVTSRRRSLGSTLERDVEGRWWVEGRRRRALDGCLDVDVAATPLTNTFPIRRLQLAIGEQRDIEVAWLDIPGLRVTRAGQRYRRLEPRGGLGRYEYRSLPDGPPHQLTVDADGVVVDYEGFAERLGPHHPLAAGGHLPGDSPVGEGTGARRPFDASYARRLRDPTARDPWTAARRLSQPMIVTPLSDC